MTGKMQMPLVFIAAIITLSYCAGSLAADAPAGQVCPRGSFVIGFDEQSNILCSETCGNRVLIDGEACDDGNTIDGDGCSALCQSEHSTVAKQKKQTSTATTHEQQMPVGTPPSNAPGASSAVTAPTISKIKPRTVVFLAREVTIAISGNGFSKETFILFKGKRYTPSVNEAGTELRVRLPTRELPMGYHAISVSNGPGMETTLQKGLEVF